MTHICVGKLTNTGSDNGLSPRRRQAIIWTNAGILLIGPLGTNFSEFFVVIHTFSFNKMHMKMSSAKLRPFCLGLNVLTLFVFLRVSLHNKMSPIWFEPIVNHLWYNNGLDLLIWTSFIPDSYSKLWIICRSVSGIDSDYTCRDNFNYIYW